MRFLQLSVAVLTVQGRRRAFAAAALFSILLVLCPVGPVAAWTQQAPLAPTDGFFDSNGVHIHYVIAGDGEPLVLIHGFSGSAAAMSRVQKELAASYKVIALDCRGHGKSDKPHDPEQYGLQMSEDIARLLNHLQIAQARIVGYSMGARIAGRFLIDHPGQVVYAVLGGAAPEIAGTASPVAEVRRRTAESLEAGKGAGPLLEFLSPVGEPRPDAKQIETLNRLLLSINDPLALAAATRGMDRLAVTAEALKANTRPVLAIVGSRDPNLQAVKALAVGMGHTEVVVIEGGSHLSVISQPSEFLADVSRFLRH